MFGSLAPKDPVVNYVVIHQGNSLYNLLDKAVAKVEINAVNTAKKINKLMFKSRLPFLVSDEGYPSLIPIAKSSY